MSLGTGKLFQMPVSRRRPRVDRWRFVPHRELCVAHRSSARIQGAVQRSVLCNADYTAPYFSVLEHLSTAVLRSEILPVHHASDRLQKSFIDPSRNPICNDNAESARTWTTEALSARKSKQSVERPLSNFCHEHAVFID